METANQEPVEITLDEFQAWQESNVTKLVLQEVEAYRDYLTKLLVTGNTLTSDAPTTTEQAVGELAGLTQLYLFFSEAGETGKVSNYEH